MANTLRKLDPQASPAALFGAEVRTLRLRHGLSLAALGRLVHVSGDLLGKIEKAERRPQRDLVRRLDDVLTAGGRIRRLGAGLHDDVGEPGVATPTLTPDSALPALRRIVDAARNDDHGMGAAPRAAEVMAHAMAAERFIRRIGRREQPVLAGTIAEAYQLAGWMSFDAGRSDRSTTLLTTSRRWADRAADAALTAFVLGPNLSFVATYGGRPALGVELAYGAWGWARRSANHRLTAFTLVMAARAHARLGEAALCLDLLDQAESALGHHRVGDDPHWLAVLDQAALAGHRGSCLRDLGRPESALNCLAEQEARSERRFLRNRIIWYLDGVDALLDLHETEQACDQLRTLVGTTLGGTVVPRVLQRFGSVELRLRGLDPSPTVADALDRMRIFNAAHA